MMALRPACLLLFLLVACSGVLELPSQPKTRWAAHAAAVDQPAVEEAAGASTTLGALQSFGRRILQVVLGGSTLTATSTTTAGVCVQNLQAVAINVSTGIATSWQNLVVQSSTTNGGSVAVYVKSSNTTSNDNVTLQAEVSVIATVHAVTSASLDGCRIKCPKVKGTNIYSSYNHQIFGYGFNFGYGYGYGYSSAGYGIIPRSNCMTREIKICPMANGKGYIVGNAVAMAAAQAKGVASAAVDANGNPIVYTASNSSALATAKASVFKRSSNGFSYSTSVAASSASSTTYAFANSYSLVTSVEVDTCVNATATASVTVKTPELKDCVIDCPQTTKGKLTWGDRDLTWARDPLGSRCADYDCSSPDPNDSHCSTRLVTQCFS